uniref:Uncharacterized protein n=1 Tax=Timspurckia oligopyrenoides TaxID=708627 RepID=A0A7S1ESJ1_9RHOD|mmetsp:Transcript_5227/g.9136  ORF Transcript_5227/g.9136 Transcript_5227/m.9136 type:complete len:363 (+) Transcript_5227:38-1126(+)
MSSMMFVDVNCLQFIGNSVQKYTNSCLLFRSLVAQQFRKNGRVFMRLESNIDDDSITWMKTDSQSIVSLKYPIHVNQKYVEREHEEITIELEKKSHFSWRIGSISCTETMNSGSHSQFHVHLQSLLDSIYNSIQNASLFIDTNHISSASKLILNQLLNNPHFEQEVNSTMYVYIKRNTLPNVPDFNALTPNQALEYGNFLKGPHSAIFVKDIRKSIQYFNVLASYSPTLKSISAGARLAWLDSTYPDLPRLELIELKESRSAPATDYLSKNASTKLPLGHYHLMWNVTRLCTSLSKFLERAEIESVEKYGKSIPVLISPTTQIMIGRIVTETAMVRDPDGALIEFLRYQTVLTHEMDLGVDF